MRKHLQQLNNIRGEFSGVFVRYGEKPNHWTGFPTKTLLLRDITDRDGRVVTDHLWFSMTKGFQACGTLCEGDILCFDARVTPYIKGYRGRRDDVYDAPPVSGDYRLSRPTKIRRQSKE